MIEGLAILTGVELGKHVLEQVLKPVLKSYVQDFFRDSLDSGVARLNIAALKTPMADAIGRREKQEMLRAIAYEMQAGEDGLKGNLISADRLTQILTQYLRDQGFNEPREKANRLIQQLRERNFILCYRGADTYGFMHRTFLEYFCAVEIVHRFEKNRTLIFEQLRDEVFGQHWQDENWHEVLQLICGMIGCQIIDTLLKELTFENQSIEFLAFSAKCLIEVRDHYRKCSFSAAALESLKKTFEAFNSKTKTWSNDNDVDILSQEASDLRNMHLVITAVAETWIEHPDTLNWLKEKGREHHIDTIRAHTLREIAANFKSDSELASFFCERAMEDPSRYIVAPISDPALMAASILAEYYSKDPRTSDILITKIKEDIDESAKVSLLSSLLKVWKDKPKMFNFLCTFVVNHSLHPMLSFSSVNSRHHALRLLLEHYPEFHDVVNILNERAANDSDERIRLWAQKQLKETRAKNNP